MKKYLALMALLVLTACGGGSGGGANGVSGNGFAGDVNGGIRMPDTFTFSTMAGYESNDIETRSANIDSTAMIDNGSKREEHIAKMYAEAGMAVPIAANGSLNENLSYIRGASAKGPNNHSNGASNGARDLFANMHEWCSEEKIRDFYNLFPDNMTDEQIDEMLENTSNLQGLMNSLRHALVLAGYGLEIKDQGNHYVIHLIKDHTQEIIDNANEIYDQMGQFQEFDITQAELYTDGDQVKFTMDGNRINGIQYIINPGQTNRDQIYSFTKQDDAEHAYHTSQRKWFYEFRNVDFVDGNDYDPAAGQNIEIEYNAHLTAIQAIDRLIAELNHMHNSEHWFTGFHSLQQADRDAAELERAQIATTCIGCSDNEINELVEERAQEIAANRMYHAALYRLNSLRTAAQNQNITEFQDLIGIDNEIGYREGDLEDININLETFGRNVGLAFADFGKMYAYDNGEEPDEYGYQVVYGGYLNNLINPNDFASDDDQTFTGKAFGRANVSYVQNHSDDDPTGTAITLNDNQAILTFHRNNDDSSTETLSASFNNWYDVLMTKTDGTARLTFSNYKYKNNNNEIDNTYRFLGDKPDEHDVYNASYSVNNFTETHMTNFLGDAHGPTGMTNGGVDIQYYGAHGTGIPSEAVGYISYSENEPMIDYPDPEHPEEDMIKEVGFDIGFGMTKDYTVAPVQP